MNEPSREMLNKFSLRTLRLTTMGGRRFMVNASDAPIAALWLPTDTLEIAEDEENPYTFIIYRVLAGREREDWEKIHASES